MSNEPFDVTDPSGLTDEDWIAINRLRRAYDCGGSEAFDRALDALQQENSFSCIRVIGAICPHELREAMRAEMAKLGLTSEELLDIVRKLESVERRLH
jgi:hypothetical protein